MRQYFSLSFFLCLWAVALPTQAKDYARLASPMLIPIGTYTSAAPATASSPLRPASQALEADTYRPVLSPYRLSGGLPGIVRDGGVIKVTYQFDDTPADATHRPLSPKEKQIVREVLQQLSRFIPLSFREDRLAYLHFTAAEIAAEGVEGFANLPDPFSASMIGGRVVLNQSLCDSASLQADCTLFRRVVRHEMGHVLGLQHPWEAGAEYEKMPSVMSYEAYMDYQQADIAALQHLYGAAHGSRMLADARAIAAEKNKMENVWAEISANPAHALKAVLSETNPTAPPCAGFHLAPPPAQQPDSGAVGAMLSRIFGHTP